MKKGIRNIAYGVSDFENIRTSNDYFVDKTSFIPLLEQSRYLFFIRPRRFGKSLWVSILETYYDQAKKDRFDTFFKGTWIGDNPTDEASSYLILVFNFSAVRADSEYVEASFESYCETRLSGFLEKYADHFSELIQKKIKEKKNIAEKLSLVFEFAGRHGLSLYILIDEYDNFANTILSTAGLNAYHSLTHGEGFFRHFFSVLKEGTSHSGSGLKRLFITGVSPITMDDVTSGFNIGSNVSLDPLLGEMVGFTRRELKTMLVYYQKEGVFLQDVEKTIELMEQWYCGYRFEQRAEQSLYNPDMLLYFVKNSIRLGYQPDELIDHNIRIDYGKLRHLLLVNQQLTTDNLAYHSADHRNGVPFQLNGNFDQLKQIIEDGETLSMIHTSFSLEQLNQPDNFISLLYYFGLLSIDGPEKGRIRLKIPNQTVKHLMYGYLREAYRDVETFQVDFWKLDQMLQAMAWDGQWEAFFDRLADAIKEQSSIRDYLQGEKVIQGFLLAYLHLCDFFIARSEPELGKGYADLLLEPFLAKYPDMPCGYVVELKYFKRNEFRDDQLQSVVDEAKSQLKRYLKDERIQKFGESIHFQGIVLVFHGWELVYRGCVSA